MKKVVGQIKLQIPAGKATPAPPVGPALGQAGVNIMDFCKAFNARTAKDDGLIIPVVGVGVLSGFTGTFPAVLAFSVLLAALCLFSVASIRRAL